MKEVKIIGAGFSGLTAAYYLHKAGYRVEIIERENSAGGLIQSRQTHGGLVESAANAIMNNILFEDLCYELGIEILATEKSAKSRYIYRNGRPHRWPFSFRESVKIFFYFLRTLLKRRSLHARERESVADWSDSFFGPVATSYLIEPALGGIYAERAAELDAELVLAFLAKEKAAVEKPKIRGSVAPKEGMGDFLLTLAKYLQRKGVKFRYGAEFDAAEEPPSMKIPVVLATSVAAAAKIIYPIHMEVSAELSRIQILPLATATVFYPRSAGALPGFGCLFPRDEKFHALGVLFNSYIFSGRSQDLHSETWIFGGAESALSLDDDMLLDRIALDRLRLYGSGAEPISAHIRRWPHALPLYNSNLKKFLRASHTEELEKKNIFLHGNYLGRIGLAGILERSAAMPDILLGSKK